MRNTKYSERFELFCSEDRVKKVTGVGEKEEPGKCRRQPNICYFVLFSVLLPFPLQLQLSEVTLHSFVALTVS